ncbi:MAG: RNA-binding cell elongation regulator Jag/EloR [Candidatus Geothermincolia bacterium]
MREKAWEYTGRTVDEATQIALEELGLERDDINVEVLEESQKGFLGLGGKGARIKVELIGEWEVSGKKAVETPQVEEPEQLEADTPRRSTPREPEIEEEEDEFIPRETSDKPVKMVEDILSMIGVDAMVESHEREDSVVVDIWGDDVAILIGKGGATLDALQYLVNIGCRRTGEVSRKIIVDAEGYRKRRKAKLEKQAEQMAGDAISQGRSIEMLPMSASERKIVHMALRKVDGVWTESAGEDPGRRVVIHPEK